MAVTPPAWLKDVLRWRWTPTVALIVGALLYVAGATALVPSEIRFAPAQPSSPATTETTGTTVRDDSAADTDATTDTGETATRARRKRARRRAAGSDAETTTADATAASE